MEKTNRKIMSEVEKFIEKVSSIWIAIGAFLAASGFTSLFNIDLGQLFSQETLDVALAVSGTISLVIGYIKRLAKEQAAEAVRVLSTGAKVVFALNPFKVSI